MKHTSRHNMMDAQQAFTFAVNQSLVVNSRVYAIRYPSYDFGRLMFVDTSSPEWASGVLTYISDMSGQAKWQSGFAKDVPLADANMSSVEKTFQMGAVGYQWNIEELGKAAFQNIPLTSRKAAAARQAYAQFMWNLALYGDTAKGYQGLVNSSLVTSGLFPNDGTGTSRLWADKTPAQIVRDINSLLQGIWTDTLEIELADTLLLPSALALYLASTPYSAYTTETILDFIKDKNVFTIETGRPLTIRAVRGLEDAGASGVGRVVAYRNAEEVVRLHLPMPHRFLPTYQDGAFNYVNPGIFRTGGVEISLPLSVRYGDGAVA